MRPYDQNISTFEAMFDGYVEALSRFEAAAKTLDPKATYVPLFEALNWAVALDDRTAAHFVPDGKPIGFGWRGRIPYGEIMAGVRFARNSVHHQWSDALELRGGAHLPLTFAVTFSEWTWRSADQLPAPDKQPHPEGERSYREEMEGRPARVSLDVLGGVFLTLKELLEPYTIPRAPEGFVLTDDYVDEPDDPWR